MQLNIRAIHTLTVLLSVCACAGSPDYVFRNDERPPFDQQISVADLKTQSTAQNLVLLDVRLAEDYAADPVLIPGALYRNPEDIAEWSSSLPGNSKVVVYCVKGRWVSQKAANYLDGKGFEVYSLDGGIQAWQAQEGTL